MEAQVGKDVAMQAAAMSPIALDETSIDQATIDKELEIGKELAIKEGKPAEMAENIAKGRLKKWFRGGDFGSPGVHQEQQAKRS